MLWLLTSVLFFLGNAASPLCPAGSFKVGNMTDCHAFLNCQNMNNISLLKEIGSGAVKIVYLADWNGHYIAASKLRNANYVNDFHHNWKMLEKFQRYPFFVQPVGFCEKTYTILTEYHPFGSALGMVDKLAYYGIDPEYSASRINLCWVFAKILETLHENKMVNCDSNSLEKTLSQFLVNKDGDIVLNDMDALAENIDGVTCGSKPLYGDFVAPEQTGWPLPKYDEKTDIWKTASVCEYFLSNLTDDLSVRYYLHLPHIRCKHKVPAERPSATEMVNTYYNAIKKFWGDL